jgi:hypothetical protein
MQAMLFSAVASAGGTAPVPLSETWDSTGGFLSVLFDQPVTFGAGGNGGWSVSMSGGATTMAYSSGSGSSTIVLSSTRLISRPETGTMSYTNPGSGAKGVTGGVAVANISGATTTNNSAIAQFSDDFNRVSLGANWSVVSGACDLSANKFRANTASFAFNLALYQTGSFGVTQYIKTKMVTGQGEFAMWAFRYLNSSSPFYLVYFSGGGGGNHNKFEWQSYASLGASGNGLAPLTAAQTFVDGDTLGIIVSGTGTGTSVKLFKNPVAAAPLSATHWDSGDTPMATINWTGGFPGTGSPANTGTFMGIGGEQTVANTITHDDFAGGAI